MVMYRVVTIAAVASAAFLVVALVVAGPTVSCCHRLSVVFNDELPLVLWQNNNQKNHHTTATAI